MKSTGLHLTWESQVSFHISLRIDKQLEVLHEFANTLSKKKSEKHETETSENVATFMSFLDLYGNQAEKLDNEKFLLSEEIKQLEEQLSVSRINHVKLSLRFFKRTK